MKRQESSILKSSMQICTYNDICTSVAISSEDPIPHDGRLHAPPTNRHAPHRD